MAKGELARWLSTAKAGRCPCGKPAEQLLCGATECRKHYLALYQKDRRGPSGLQPVVSKVAEGRRIRVTLACGHHEDLSPSLARELGQRRHCPTCG